MFIDEKGASYHYNANGTNTLTQISKDPVTVYRVGITNRGGSVGFLQLYENGSADAGAGTPDLVIPVFSGTAAAGTPTIMAIRDVDLGPTGVAFQNGLSYIWAAGATGTVAHGVTGNLYIIYKGTG